MSPRQVGLAIALFLALPAWAGPPFVTDDPEPVEHRHWEINAAVTDTWSHGQASAGIPSVDINYGAAPNVQLHAQPRFSLERAGGDTRTGLDDTEVGVKYRFLDIEQGDTKTMVGIYPMYQLPTGDTGLGPTRGKRQVFLPMWLQREAGKWTLYGGAGYRVNRGAGSKSSVFTGATALYKVSEGLQLGGEVFHETQDTIGGEARSGFNVGGIHKLVRDCNLLFSAGSTFGPSAAPHELSAYLALQLLY